MSDDDDILPIVIDNGSFHCKSGFAGDDAPRSIFPSIIGNQRNMSIVDGKQYLDTYVGDDAQARRGMLAMRKPIVNGVVKDWDAMEAIWSYVFESELRVDSAERDVLLTEPLLNPKSNREKMIEVMFETFNSPGFYVATDGTLAIYASGRGTAISIGVGHELLQAYPVYEGYTIKESHTRSNLGGSDVTKFLNHQLHLRGYFFTDQIEYDMCNDMKQRACYAAEEFEKEMHLCNIGSSKIKSYELPDGSMIQLGAERSKATEVLFNPKLIDKEVLSVQEVVLRCLDKCDMDTRRDFYCNLVLYGGSSMFPGMAERLTKEIGDKVPKKMNVKVVAAPERKLSVWIGGSILASLSTFANVKVTSQEYDENGPSIVHTKCVS